MSADSDLLIWYSFMLQLFHPPISNPNCLPCPPCAVCTRAGTASIAAGWGLGATQQHMYNGLLRGKPIFWARNCMYTAQNFILSGTVCDRWKSEVQRATQPSRLCGVGTGRNSRSGSHQRSESAAGEQPAPPSVHSTQPVSCHTHRQKCWLQLCPVQ